VGDVKEFPNNREREFRERFGDLIEFDERQERTRVESARCARIMRAAGGAVGHQLECIPRADELDPATLPPAYPMECISTGVELPELVYVVLRAGVDDGRAAAILYAMARSLQEGRAFGVTVAPSSSDVPVTDDNVIA
jgi:hypothetical protein